MSLLESERRGAVLTLTLADEPRRNALSAELVGELLAALEAAESDPDVRIVVLTNRGSAFCAGGDLKKKGEGASAEAPDRSKPSAPDLFAHFARSSKAHVGRIAGHCVGGGVGLAAALDVSIAADDATFGFSEVRLGVAPAIISVVCLPKMRVADAREHFLRGDRFDAAEAARMGLVNRAVPRQRLDDEVDAVVSDILAGSPAALAASKRLLTEVPRLSADEAFTWTAQLSAQLFASTEAQQGIAAFRAKEPAPWVRAWPPPRGHI